MSCIKSADSLTDIERIVNHDGTQWQLFLKQNNLTKNCHCICLEGENLDLFNEFIQGLFHILIPQTIDHGIQHREHHSVKCRNYFVPVQRIARSGTRVDVENGAIVQGDRDQVGGTCGEGLEAALGGADFHDGGNDEQVGREDEHCWGDDIGGQEEV